MPKVVTRMTFLGRELNPDLSIRRLTLYRLSHAALLMKVGSGAKVCQISNRMWARQDKFKMTLKKFQFAQKMKEPRTRKLSAKDFELERSISIKKMRQSGVITFDKLRKTRRRLYV